MFFIYAVFRRDQRNSGNVQKSYKPCSVIVIFRNLDQETTFSHIAGDSTVKP